MFALGDCSSLPTSKTAAAIAAQAPVLVHNLLGMREGRKPNAQYDGYTSCPLLLGYGSLMLAEFKYGGVPKETFGRWWDQGRPTWAFYRYAGRTWERLGIWRGLCVEVVRPGLSLFVTLWASWR